MKTVLIVLAMLVVLSIAGCMWLEYDDSLGNERNLVIPSGWTTYEAVINTGDGPKKVVVAQDEFGKCWYADDNGEFQPVQGDLK